MRIAQVAPLFESVPPKLYGGTERVVSNLSEALVQRGHEVTLFASGDSLTSARLVPCSREGLRLGQCRDPLAAHIVQFEYLRDLADDFDVIHLHTDVLHLGLVRTLDAPVIFTLHGRLDLPEHQELYARFRNIPLTSISLYQRRPLPFANWVGNVYHGIDPQMIEFSPRDGKYLAFLGRITPEKGIEQAIEIAERAGLPLKVAAKVDPSDRDYYSSIKALFEKPFVEFIGEIGDREKSEFLGRASALIFPIQWPEPFGIVMIESLAAGTPVIAFKNGSVPEVIRHGVTGYVVETVEAAVEAVGHLGRIDRRLCRREFEERFTRDLMAQGYIEIFEALVERRLEERQGRQSLRASILSRDQLESRYLI